MTIDLNTAYDNKDVITQIYDLKRKKQDKLTAGTNITISEQNVISATGGGGTTDYNSLTNKPKINSVELIGNRSLSTLGIQPAGSYATSTDLTEGLATKQNTLTAGAGIAITNDTISCTIPGFEAVVVQTLPETGEAGKIYLVPALGPTSQNIYNEFIWVNNAWEQIGTTQIDLSQYKVWTETKTYIDTADALKQDVSGMPHVKIESV